MKRKKVLDTVDVSDLEVNSRVVAVNGKDLPLAIGDKIKITDDDHLVKTVMGVQIFEDGRVSYALEWFDEGDGSFKVEWVTMTEIKLLNRNQLIRKKIHI